MRKFIRGVGDRLLTRLVPQLDASACTAPELECWCDTDGQGTDPRWCCQECRWCPGSGNICRWGGCTHGC